MRLLVLVRVACCGCGNGSGGAGGGGGGGGGSLTRDGSPGVRNTHAGSDTFALCRFVFSTEVGPKATARFSTRCAGPGQEKLGAIVGSRADHDLSADVHCSLYPDREAASRDPGLPLDGLGGSIRGGQLASSGCFATV